MSDNRNPDFRAGYDGNMRPSFGDQNAFRDGQEARKQEAWRADRAAHPQLSIDPSHQPYVGGGTWWALPIGIIVMIVILYAFGKIGRYDHSAGWHQVDMIAATMLERGDGQAYMLASSIAFRPTDSEVVDFIYFGQMGKDDNNAELLRTGCAKATIQRKMFAGITYGYANGPDVERVLRLCFPTERLALLRAAYKSDPRNMEITFGGAKAVSRR